MQRNVSLDEISDGRLYGAGDMVKLGCDDCKGCSACCHGVGSTIVLDPYDVYRMTAGLNKTLEELISASQIELNVVDGIILPNLKLSGPEEACAFLNQEGRCSIHPYRPGICRLFPLGRIYEDHGFRYFNQVHECKKEARTKVKIRKWIDTPDISRYEKYIAGYHFFLKELEARITAAIRINSSEGEETAKNISMYVLKNFYLTPYDVERDFYEQFQPCLLAAKEYWEIV